MRSNVPAAVAPSASANPPTVLRSASIVAVNGSVAAFAASTWMPIFES